MKKDYIGLWLLLAFGLAAITVYSFSEVELDGVWQPKRAPIADKLTFKPKTSSPDSLFAKSMESALLLENRVDSTPQIFLLIGDSMTLNLAYRLNDYAEKNGHKAYSVNWDSSNTSKWAKSDRLDEFIKEKQPTIVLVSLGSNELFVRQPDALKPNIQKILNKIGDRPFIWIGPPNWKKDEGLNDMLEAFLPAGTFFRTEGMELDRKGDHIHPTRAAAALWMDSIMSWQSKRSSHPFLATRPEGKAKNQSAGITLFKANE